MGKIARRGKARYGNSFTVRDQYKEYHKRHKGTPLDISYQQFKRLVGDFNEAMMNHVVKDCGEFKLPFRLGKITITKRKLNYDDIRKLPVDWKRSKELGFKVRLFNEHSNEYKYRIRWIKKDCAVRGQRLWAFIPTREFSRSIAYEVKHNGLDYFAA